MAIHNRVSLTFKDNVNAEIVTFDIKGANEDDFALVFAGKKKHPDGRLVRVHSECITGDLFGSKHCDCGFQLTEAFGKCAKQGGILLYLRQEGRGIGLRAKIDAYAVQRKEGVDTHEANLRIGHQADERSYSTAAQMLKDLGETRIRLITNNPAKMAELRENGIDVTTRVKTKVYATAHNLKYLQAKREAGHFFTRLLSIDKDI